jgi:hypothetical protein
MGTTSPAVFSPGADHPCQVLLGADAHDVDAEGDGRLNIAAGCRERQNRSGAPHHREAEQQWRRDPFRLARET